MRILKIAIIALLLTILPSLSTDSNSADKVMINEGFTNGEEYLDLPEHAQIGYAMGIIDGYLGAPLFNGDDAFISDIPACMSGKTNKQIAAIVRVYLQENPRVWDVQMNILMLKILKKEICDQQIESWK
jgi:hypothetical protein